MRLCSNSLERVLESLFCSHMSELRFIYQYLPQPVQVLQAIKISRVLQEI